MASIFKEKHNKARELAEKNERRIELIQDKMNLTTSGFDSKKGVAGSIAGDAKLQEYLNRVEYHQKEQDHQQALRERNKAEERKKKEMETRDYLDRQIEAKKERREREKNQEHRLAERVQADVKAFEESRRESKIHQQNKMGAHLDGLMRQIEEQKAIPKNAPHVAKIGMSVEKQELLLNKKLIEDVEADAPLPGPKATIKRPF